MESVVILFCLSRECVRLYPSHAVSTVTKVRMWHHAYVSSCIWIPCGCSKHWRRVSARERQTGSQERKGSCFIHSCSWLWCFSYLHWRTSWLRVERSESFDSSLNEPVLLFSLCRHISTFLSQADWLLALVSGSTARFPASVYSLCDTVGLKIINPLFTLNR